MLGEVMAYYGITRSLRAAGYFETTTAGSRRSSMPPSGAAS